MRVVFVLRATLIGLLALTSTARASLILGNPPVADLGGTGFGSVLSLLTIHNPQGPTETGSVAWNGTQDVFAGADVVPGAPHSLTRTFAELGWLNAGEIRIIANLNETGASISATLTNLVMTIYNSAGGVVFSSGPFTPVFFPDIAQGTGQSGFVFLLDAAQRAALNAAIPNFSANPTYRVGLAASWDSIDDGPETFFAARVPSLPDPIPEPATFVLIGTGLVAASLVRRRA